MPRHLRAWVVAAAAVAAAAVRPAALHAAETADPLPVYTVEVYSLRGLIGGPGAPDGASAEARRREAERVADLLRAVVRPGSWDDPRASIAHKPAGSLTVAQTAPGHAAVRRLLTDLRVHRGTHITIRTRAFTYYLPSTQAVVTRAMGLDGAGPANVVIEPAEADRFIAAMKQQRDVTEMSSPTLTMTSGGHAYVSVGTERGLSTRWRRSGEAPAAPSVSPVELSVFEGQALRVGATASADRRSVTLDVSPLITLLAGDRPVNDAIGRINLPEFHGSSVHVSARVPAGHSLLVGGLRTRVDPPGASRSAHESRGRRGAAVVVVVSPTVSADDAAAAPKAARRERALHDLEAMSVLGRMRRWAPGAAADPALPAAPAGRITISSRDGLVTLDLNLDAGDVRTPGIDEWLRRLFSRPGLTVRRPAPPSEEP